MIIAWKTSAATWCETLKIHSLPVNLSVSTCPSSKLVLWWPTNNSEMYFQESLTQRAHQVYTLWLWSNPQAVMYCINIMCKDCCFLSILDLYPRQPSKLCRRFNSVASRLRLVDPWCYVLWLEIRLLVGHQYREMWISWLVIYRLPTARRDQYWQLLHESVADWSTHQHDTGTNWKRDDKKIKFKTRWLYVKTKLEMEHLPWMLVFLLQSGM